MVYRVKTCSPVGCRPSGGELEPEKIQAKMSRKAFLEKLDQRIQSDEMRWDRMGADKLWRRRFGELPWALSLAGGIEPSQMSATQWEHNWTRVIPPATKEKWPYQGNEERH